MDILRQLKPERTNLIIINKARIGHSHLVCSLPYQLSPRNPNLHVVHAKLLSQSHISPLSAQNTLHYATFTTIQHRQENPSTNATLLTFFRLSNFSNKLIEIKAYKLHMYHDLLYEMYASII